MKNIVIWLAVGAVSVIALFAIWFYTFASSGWTSTSFQHDADIVRLDDIKLMGELLEEYKEKTGTYPLEGESELQYLVLIGAEGQIPTDTPTLEYDHKTMTSKDFSALLSEGLGREIQLPYDPQRVANVKPNFYIYMMNQDTYYFAVHLHEAYGVAKKVGNYYYKLEISNYPEPPEFWGLEDLLADETYREAASRPMNKVDFLESMAHRKD